MRRVFAITTWAVGGSPHILWLPFLVLAANILLCNPGCAPPSKSSPGFRKPASRPRHIPPVRVGLAVRVPQADVRVKDSYFVFARGEAPFVVDHGDTVRLRAGAEGITFTSRTKELCSELPIVLEPRSPHARLVWGRNEYRGRFEVRQLGGQLTLINEIDMETYLRGVVPWEIGWHGGDQQAAVEAQAIAARTYAYKRLGQYPDEGFDVYADVQDQVYRGTTREDTTADRAIDNTRGSILWFAGTPIDAYYSSTCGGHTSNIEKIWRQRPARVYLQGSRDAQSNGSKAFCIHSHHFRWTEAWSGADLEETLRETVARELRLEGELGGLMDLRITERTSSGRVEVLEVEFSAGVFRIVGDRIRWVLRPRGRSILRSTMFDIDIERNLGHIQRVVVRGGGNGHGVGMCQMGALEMSRFGYGHAAILAHYYPGTELRRMY